MNWSSLTHVTLVHTSLWIVLFTALVLGVPALARDAFLHDYPREIQERYGEKSARGRRAAAWGGVVMALMFAGIPLAAMLDLRARTGGDLGFWPGFVFGTVALLTICVWDLVVVDWLLFCRLQLRVFVLPGTEGMAAYRDYAFHWKVMVPRPVPWPLLMIPGLGLLVGTATVLLETLT